MGRIATASKTERASAMRKRRDFGEGHCLSLFSFVTTNELLHTPRFKGNPFLLFWGEVIQRIGRIALFFFNTRKKVNYSVCEKVDETEKRQTPSISCVAYFLTVFPSEFRCVNE